MGVDSTNGWVNSPWRFVGAAGIWVVLGLTDFALGRHGVDRTIAWLWLGAGLLGLAATFALVARARR